MDYISGLPTTLHKHDAIWVVFFRFSKMAIFIPCHNTTFAIQTTELFFHNVWPHFGLPQSIIYDCDSHFLSIFWHTLWSILGCNIKFSMEFHLQTNDQSEVVNQLLVYSLHTYFEKNKQWDTYLHIIQHSYNQDFHLLIGYSLFEVCLSFQPLASFEIPLMLSSEGSVHQQKEKISAQQYIQRISQCHA